MSADTYRILKAKKETPCCHQQVRVKIVEPGVQVRKCPLCKEISHFALEPTSIDPRLLRLRWMGDDEVAELESGLSELDVTDL